MAADHKRHSDSKLNQWSAKKSQQAKAFQQIIKHTQTHARRVSVCARLLSCQREFDAITCNSRKWGSAVEQYTRASPSNHPFNRKPFHFHVKTLEYHAQRGKDVFPMMWQNDPILDFQLTSATMRVLSHSLAFIIPNELHTLIDHLIVSWSFQKCQCWNMPL